MSDQVAKVGKNLERFKAAINAHDRENPTHDAAYGIGVNAFDLDRLGFDDGEQLWPGVTIETDGGVTGNFRVLCNGEHEEQQAEAERADAVAHAMGVTLP